MRSSRSERMIYTLALGFALNACGIIIGNPGDSEPETANSEFVQTVDYDIPNGVSGYELVEDQPDGIFDDSARRIDETIDRVNQMITRLNTDAVKEEGSFTGKGEDHEVSGSILPVTDSAIYNYKATICYKGVVFQMVEWSSETGSVHTIRDHSVDPVDSKRRTNRLSEINYVKGDSSTIDVWMTEKADKTIPGADGQNLADHTAGTYANGVFTLAGVHNWFNDPTTVTSEGDEYFIGTFNDESVGENVTFNSFRPDCGTFDDTASTHTWCGGRALPDGVAYTDAERAAAAERLKAIPVLAKTTLQSPKLPTDLSCP